MASILLLDNYDSFTFNLLHYVEEYGHHQIEVFRNDQIEIAEVNRFEGIILSPGPGLPHENGNMMEIIERYHKTKRIFGVCLGLQAIAQSFGAKLMNLSTVFHGVSSKMHLNLPVHYIFKGIPSTFEAGRYHSWVVSSNDLPSCLRIEAFDDNGLIMALSHKTFDVCGVQFHPESILTPDGKKIVFNWLSRF